MIDVPRNRNVINNVFFHSREEIRETVERFINWLSTVPQIVIDCLCLQAIIYHFIYSGNINNIYILYDLSFFNSPIQNSCFGVIAELTCYAS